MSRVLPVLFNTEMVKAILDGRKTVTRRLVKPRSKNACGFYVTTRPYDGAFMGVYDYDENEKMFDNSQTPPYQVGDILYVRETWLLGDGCNGEQYYYKADETENSKECRIAYGYKWHPSLHMPKEAARIFLKVMDIRVERLQDITADGIRNEGLTSMCVHCGDMEIAIKEWENLWNSTVKEDWQKFDRNPWVWVISFERCEKPSEVEINEL